MIFFPSKTIKVQSLSFLRPNSKHIALHSFWMAFATVIYVDKVNYLNMIKEKLVKKHSPFMSNGSTIQITTKLWFTPVYQQRMYHLPTEATGRRLRPML